MAPAPGDLSMIGALDTGLCPIPRPNFDKTREVISEKLLA